MKKTAALILLAICATLMSCDKDAYEFNYEDSLGKETIYNGHFPKGSHDAISLTRSQQEMAARGNSLSTAMLLSDIANKKDEENVLLSPLSLQIALGMLANGLNDKALKDYLKAMYKSKYTLDELNDFYHLLEDKLCASTDAYTCCFANAIWAQQDYSIEKDFIQTCSTCYDAVADYIDFTQPEQAKSIIDKWAFEHTYGMIPHVTLDINIFTRMVLANACYFKGTWVTPFEPEKTDKQHFTPEHGAKYNVDMMHQTRRDYYAETDDYQSVTLPYLPGNYSMMLVLPQKGKTVEKVLPNVDWTGTNSKNYADIELSIPKFDLQTTNDLIPVLRQLGMSSLLAAGAVSHINEDLEVNQVNQDVHVIVNEKGTEAAAVTVISMEGCIANPIESEKVTLTFDRPFAFAIRENSTGIILFIGKVGKP